MRRLVGCPWAIARTASHGSAGCPWLIAGAASRDSVGRSWSVAEAVVDGVKGFLFLDKNGMPTVALHWEKYLKHAVQNCNRIFREEMPRITPHVCRHTFRIRMVGNGMSTVKLQYLMGHSDIATTYGVYTHLEPTDLKDELLEL
ncbi:MAG: tyrosine-type recombinase/integrase [Slackia sp.]|nr:tyrosine-type recombinase/integrase [Slackia sp.]